MNKQMAADNENFIKEYQSALSHALGIFDSRQKEGRNLFMPPLGMFCFGYQSAATLIWMKACRLNGNVIGNNEAKILEECEDIINYAAMLMALVRISSKHINPEK